ncbi:FAD/NAD(P)-binding protein [Mycolicibacterium komossense]|uniref:FAD/NAD(P)-binding protein n=1 Tax=Mycolicibacterium komossense TaxID=1779 RepID=A0ABT3C7R4_9MYCO|nr:FAD/NAD(P)-binding protein [Mycolicibacterium komossense]MCV7225523.1 FAD/NAD(P)-binding protein [Mycolicibacterium komossense]
MTATTSEIARPTRIIVVGGGFSGALTAVNIARLSEYPAHITVVNDGRPVGRGVAYALRRPEYLLNVAARNMSAFPDEPDHFLHWLQTRSEFGSLSEIELRERFIPRQIYGDYLCSIVQHHLQSPGGRTPVSAEFVTSEAVDIEPREPGCVVRLADGSALEADRVILATGNESPSPLPGSESLADHPAWVGNPWQPWEERLAGLDVSTGAGVVILGTGLTAVDIIITLRTMGWLGSIHTVSRHGWFPHAHFRGIEYPEFPPEDLDLATVGLDGLLDLIQHHCAILNERNENPAIIVDKLRPHTQRIWSGFTREERLAFAGKHAARWNVYRHRIAPVLHAQITGSQLTGQLRAHAANIEVLEASRDRILVHLQDRQPLLGHLVINATGPATKFTATRSVLLQNLLRRDLVAPDETNMGVRVDSDHTVVTAGGDRSPWLLALGPQLKGTYWETIAVPELRGQARRVAETVLGSAATRDKHDQLVLEYMI